MQLYYFATLFGLCILGARCTAAETQPDGSHANEQPIRPLNAKTSISTNSDAILAPVGPPGSPTPRVEVPAWWQRRFESMNARLKHDNADLIFIGDSITQRWEQDGKEVWKRYYSKRNAVNLGIDGDRTQQVLWRLDHGNIDGISPKLAVLMIGTNNILSAPAEDIAKAIQVIVERLRTKLPRTKILVLGILPRAATNGDKEEDVREMIAKINERIATLADGKMVFFFDMGPKYLREDGTLLREAFTSDMVHLASKGYEIWADAIESTVATLMRDADPRGRTAE